MKLGTAGILAAVVIGLVLATGLGLAHHPIPAKFDDRKPLTLSGIVTLLDWRNPHVHVFMNVRGTNETVNWAVELESPIELQQSGWNSEALQPGDAITVEGIAARNGSNQVWARSIVMTGTGRRVLSITPSQPPAPLQVRATPKWPDGQPRLGSAVGGMRATGPVPARPCCLRTALASRWMLTACSKTSPMPQRWRHSSHGLWHFTRIARENF